MTGASGTSPSRHDLLRTAVGGVVGYVHVSERRRVGLIVGVVLLFWLVVELAANLGFVPLVAATGLGAFLYTRSTAQETLAASAYGTGLLGIGFALLQIYRTVSGGSTEPLTDTVLRLSGWPLAGAALIVLGIWIRSSDF